MPDMDLITDFSEFEELEAMFGQDSSELEKMEKVMLTQNLEGFLCDRRGRVCFCSYLRIGGKCGRIEAYKLFGDRRKPK